MPSLLSPSTSILHPNSPLVPVASGDQAFASAPVFPTYETAALRPTAADTSTPVPGITRQGIYTAGVEKNRHHSRTPTRSEGRSRGQKLRGRSRGRSHGSRAARKYDFAKKLQNRHAVKKCEITGSENCHLQGAHIFPLGALQEYDRNEPMWDMLEMFWPPDHVQELKSCLHANHNYIANGINLSPAAHSHWDSMDFYLEVDWSSITANKYRAQFHWAVEPQDLPNYWKKFVHSSGKILNGDMETGDWVSRSYQIHPPTPRSPGKPNISRV